MNGKLVIKLNCYILLFNACVMLLPLLVALIYKEKSGLAFLPAILIALAISVPVLIFLKPKNKDIYAKEGLITVALAWIILSFVSGLPFFFSKEIPNLIDCFFETASGFTTTGATILTNVEALSRCMLFWRSFTHWIGGMGVLMFVMALAPLAGNHNMQLIKAESAGPKIEKLMPKANTTAKVLYGMYVGLTALQIIFLLIGKMPLFDAITTAFGTAGTGGFGIKNDSLASYSIYIQSVVTVFMILFSINFNMYFFLIFRKFSSIWKNEELRTFVCIVFASILLITLNNFKLFSSLGGAIHHNAFTVASVISTSGFATVDFNLWPEFSKAILFILMFVGACAGSTGGGMKVSRFIILAKSLKKEFMLLIHPRSVKTINLNGKKLENDVVKRVNSYMICYLLVFVASFIIISLDKFNFETNVTAIAATLNNIGPGFASVGPVENFSGFSWFSKLVLSFDMICGRLEIFPMMILFLPTTWRKM